MRLSEDEATPLLPQSRITPLPRVQIMLLLLMRITEPISYTVIFPFVNQMLEDVAHIPKSKVGYYAGVVESVFALVQFVTVYHWGALSDRIGRKIVALVGLAGVFVSVLSFGLSRSFTAMIVTRCIAGAMNGNVAVVKSMMAEITDSTNQARAFSLLPVSWAIGATVGPLIGGYLSHPAEQYPSVFGNIAFLKIYPYFLPCLIASITNATAITIGTFYLKETLVPKSRDVRQQHITSSDGESAQDDASTESRQAPAVRTSARAMFTGDITRILTSWFLLALLNSSYQALIPLFSYSAYENGGLGFSTNHIGLLLSINGVTALFTQTMIFPRLERRMGPVKTYRLAMSFLPLVFLALPFAHVVVPLGKHAVWGVLIGMVAAKTLSNMGVVCNSLLINNAAPSRDMLGSLNGVTTACSSLSRAFGPAGATSLFALSIEKNIFGGYFVHAALVSTALFTFAMTGRLREVEPAWRKQHGNSG